MYLFINHLKPKIVDKDIHLKITNNYETNNRN